MFARRLHLAAIVSASCAIACGHAPPVPGEPGASAYYRQALTDQPKGERAIEFRDALEKSEFEDARHKGDILAFRTFLSEFPDGPHQREARTLLEALRWNDAAQLNTEVAFQGFLADEPRGVHAQEAWARIAAMQLDSAQKSGDANQLRAWLEAHPTALDRERAERALAEAEFRDAQAAPLAGRAQRYRAYLAAHPAGPHRDEVEALESRVSIDEAALLEDLPTLRSWARSGDAHAKDLLEQLSLEEAAARLDLSTLVDIAAGKTPQAARAQAIVAQLRRSGARAKLLTEAARALYLPRSRGGAPELPSGPRERAQEIREVALSLDGEALGLILAELGSAHAHVALAAFDAAIFLLSGLPADEASLRASRAEAALVPIAQDGPHLAALAIVRLAQGDRAGALAAARSAATHDPRSLVSQLVSAQFEAPLGEDGPLARLAAKNLMAAAQASLAARAEQELRSSAPAGTPVEEDAAPTLWALCATERAARAAAELLAPTLSEEPGRKAARDDALLLIGNVSRRLGAAERASHKEGACAADRDLLARDAAIAAAARAHAASLLIGMPALSAEAIGRAARRDPALPVRQAIAAPELPASPLTGVRVAP
jgi:hypothetical protein